MNNYFSDNEFRCKCGCGCGINYMSSKLISMLNLARELLNEPIIISSAYRCKNHNSNIGGVNNSAHSKGLAVDIVCNDNEYRFKLLKVLFKVGFNRIELAPTWIHIDIDDSKPQNVAFYKHNGNY